MLPNRVTACHWHLTLEFL